MPVFRLSRHLVFPDPSLAEPDGLLAVGGDLSVERLLLAYRMGIFPWYAEDTPILWWSPDPRLVLEPKKLHIPKSLRKVLNSGRYRITLDADFEAVIRNCAKANRPEGPGTWLVKPMIEAYIRLHKAGHAHSVEAWDGEHLAGGIYGVSIGKAFFGESMFYRKPNASKVALVGLVRMLEEQGYELMDCQQTTKHMQRFGAEEWGREEFLERLEQAIKAAS